MTKKGRKEEKLPPHRKAEKKMYSSKKGKKKVKTK